MGQLLQLLSTFLDILKFPKQDNKKAYEDYYHRCSHVNCICEGLLKEKSVLDVEGLSIDDDMNRKTFQVIEGIQTLNRKLSEKFKDETDTRRCKHSDSDETVFEELDIIECDTSYHNQYTESDIVDKHKKDLFLATESYISTILELHDFLLSEGKTTEQCAVIIQKLYEHELLNAVDFTSLNEGKRDDSL